MNTAEIVNWQDFKKQLLANPDLHLQFQFAEGQWVDQSYHITEIKQAPITSVDCGGALNTWTEIILQLLEPETIQQNRAMKAKKAISIINVVERLLPLDPSGMVKIEFGNSQFETRQMFPGNITIQGENLVVDLHPDLVQCKALNRGAVCGTTDSDDCCTPRSEKPKIESKNPAVSTQCCTPGAGCC